MGFPSLACLTCKARRVKCDSIQPSCGRCRKASRNCTWGSENQGTGLLFKNENAFAQGRPRRPRTQRPREDSHVQNSTVLTKTVSSISQSPSLPLELHAFHYWLENFATWPDELLDVGMGYGAFALSPWNGAHQDSSLHLSLSALSLAMFGQAKRMKQALDRSFRFYAQSVKKAQEEMKELSNETLDQLLVTTALLSSYDQFMYESDGLITHRRSGGAASAQDRHIKGTVALMRVRQQRGYPQNQLLERAVRQPIIRSYILQGWDVPLWIQDGALYGEQGLMLQLDFFTIRMATIRSKGFEIFHDRNVNRRQPCIDKLRSLTAEAQELDLALVGWSRDVPVGWKTSTHSSSDISRKMELDAPYNGPVNLGHIAVWQRYYTVRLILNSIHLQMISSLGRPAPGKSCVDPRLERCKKTISSLATDLCCTIPVFLDHSKSMQDSMSFNAIQISGDARENIDPKAAAITAWPLTVAVGISVLPEAQKRCLQGWLRLIANILGANILQSGVEEEIFKF